jgi:hypothetical protein
MSGKEYCKTLTMPPSTRCVRQDSADSFNAGSGSYAAAAAAALAYDRQENIAALDHAAQHQVRQAGQHRQLHGRLRVCSSSSRRSVCQAREYCKVQRRLSGSSSSLMVPGKAPLRLAGQQKQLLGTATDEMPQ